MPPTTPFRDLLDLHVTTTDPDTLEAEIEQSLAVLTSTKAAAADKRRAHNRLELVGGWFEGSSEQVIALIRALAALDPPRRERRKAALLSAWSHRLTNTLS